uniref:Uncharacterized protein n=1 Tax=Romanomermis culicivorax TaxID=13658 RepID=A0A915JWP6_ROMCU
MQLFIKKLIIFYVFSSLRRHFDVKLRQAPGVYDVVLLHPKIGKKIFVELITKNLKILGKNLAKIKKKFFYEKIKEKNSEFYILTSQSFLISKVHSHESHSFLSSSVNKDFI